MLKKLFARKQVEKPVPAQPVQAKVQAQQVVVPEAQRAATLAQVRTARAMKIEQARARFENQLGQLNAMIEQFQCPPDSVDARPMCPRVLDDPELTPFLLEMGLDPYLRWNMFYFAKNDVTALMTDTLIVSEDSMPGHTVSQSVLDKASDVFMTHLPKAKHLWEQTCDEFMRTGDVLKLSTMQDFIRVQVAQISGDVERGIFQNKRNNIARILDENARKAVKGSA